MTNPTFEFCSLHYLNQWLNYDRIFCDVLSSVDMSEEEKLKVLKKAAGFYKVARTLRCKDKDKNKAEYKGLGRYKAVLKIMDSLDEKEFLLDPTIRIIEVEREISAKYSGSSVLSLTTKFLWLRFKKPIIIFDKKARVAIGTKNADLAGYYKKWMEEYSANEARIEKACSSLSNQYLYSVDNDLATEHYIQDLASNSWFKERVFDIYLWHKGNNA